jgi:hypothetical protein
LSTDLPVVYVTPIGLSTVFSVVKDSAIFTTIGGGIEKSSRLQGARTATRVFRPLVDQRAVREELDF